MQSLHLPSLFFDQLHQLTQPILPLALFSAATIKEHLQQRLRKKKTLGQDPM